MRALARMGGGLLGAVLWIALPVATAGAAECMRFDAPGEVAAGRLTIERRSDAAGRPERPFILRLAAPACLDADDEEYRVKSTRTIHIYSSDEKVHAGLGRFVGKTVQVRGRPFAAHTVHHHAPIVMDISEIVGR